MAVGARAALWRSPSPPGDGAGVLPPPAPSLLCRQAAAAVAPVPLTAEALMAVPGRARVVKMLAVEGAPASSAGAGRSGACGGSL